MKCNGIFISITIAVVLCSMTSSRFLVVADAVKECHHNDECEIHEQCFEKKCVDACHIRNGVEVVNKCAAHAVCYTDAPHSATCKCIPTFWGNPEVECSQRLAITYYPANKN